MRIRPAIRVTKHRLRKRIFQYSRLFDLSLSVGFSVKGILELTMVRLSIRYGGFSCRASSCRFVEELARERMLGRNGICFNVQLKSRLQGDSCA